MTSTAPRAAATEILHLATGAALTAANATPTFVVTPIPPPAPPMQPAALLEPSCPEERLLQLG